MWLRQQCPASPRISITPAFTWKYIHICLSAASAFSLCFLGASNVAGGTRALRLQVVSPWWPSGGQAWSRERSQNFGSNLSVCFGLVSYRFGGHFRLCEAVHQHCVSDPGFNVSPYGVRSLGRCFCSSYLHPGLDLEVDAHGHTHFWQGHHWMEFAD